MAHRLFINGSEIDIVGQLEWGDDLNTLAIQVDFKTTEIIKLGSKFFIYNDTTGKEVVRGIITDREYDKNKIYSYTGFDYAFYLNKNEVVIQFNGCTISKAIEQLLNKANVPIGNIVDISVCVKKIYKKAIVSDILKELLEMATKKTGIDYIFRCKNGKICIEEFKKIEVYPTFDLNGSTINITENVGNFSAKDSIQDMKNSVTITDNKEDKIYILAQADDSASINVYGRMSVVETPDEDDKTAKSVIAKNMLAKLNKITKSRNVDLLGSDEIVKGVLLSFNYPELGFVGQHLVTATHHTIDNCLHKLSADVEVYNG